MADLFSIVNSNMRLDSLFQLQFMMFAEILAGYMLCRLKILSSSEGKLLSAYVIYLFLPCSIIASFDLEMTAGTPRLCWQSIH